MPPGPGADACTTALDKAVRDELAEHYSCGLQGYRCVDGHTGRAFVRSTSAKDDDGYFDGNAFYTQGVPGAAIQVNVFATQTCAHVLEDLVFSESTVKTPNSHTDAKASTTDNTDETKKKAQGAVDDAKAEVKMDAKRVDDKVAPVSSQFGALKTNDLIPQLNKLKPFGNGDAAKAAAIDEALVTTREETGRVRDTLRDLGRDLQGMIGDDPEISKQLRTLLADANDAALKQDWLLVQAKLDEVKNVVDKAKPAAPAPNYTTVGNVKIVVRDYVAPVPSGDDNQFFTISVSHSAKKPTTGGGAGSGAGTSASTELPASKPWPAATLSVQVDHGTYSFEGGFLFAGVYHGERFLNHKDGMDVTDCTKGGCRWASQGLLAGTFFFHRHKLVAFDRTTLIPGIQVGINSDVTKFADAVSLGGIWEPITGVGISSGVIRASRASSVVANADGTLPQEHRFLFYIGVTINSDILETIKGLGSSGEAGNAEKKK